MTIQTSTTINQIDTVLQGFKKLESLGDYSPLGKYVVHSSVGLIHIELYTEKRIIDKWKKGSDYPYLAEVSCVNLSPSVFNVTKFHCQKNSKGVFWDENTSSDPFCDVDVHSIHKI